MDRAPAFIFDLDGTLVDNVYEHVLAWRHALEEAGLPVSTWRVHRRIGMSGSLLVEELARETGVILPPDRVEAIRKRHGEIFRTMAPSNRPLPGAAELLRYLSETKIDWAIATSGHQENAQSALNALHADKAIVVTRDQVKRAKPAPDLFLEAAKRLQRPIGEALIVGDSIWDMIAGKTAGARGIGLLSGGYGRAELIEAGAMRVFDDPADLLRHIHDFIG